LDLIHDALRLSAHVIATDPSQFASQLVGRLMSHNQPAIMAFVASVARAMPSPWPNALQPSLESPKSGLLRTLGGHRDAIWGVAITSDGQRAVSGSWDRTLKVWDLETAAQCSL
jgi:WD40 repeat protein